MIVHLTNNILWFIPPWRLVMHPGMLYHVAYWRFVLPPMR